MHAAATAAAAAASLLGERGPILGRKNTETIPLRKRIIGARKDTAIW